MTNLGWTPKETFTVSSYGHLSFDAYEQDQVFTIDASQEGDKKSSGIAIIDRPDYPIVEIFELMERLEDLPQEKKKAESDKFFSRRESPSRRLYLGRMQDSSVGIKLMDAQGRERILIQVDADGSPIIKFLDASGTVISRLPAE